MEVATRIGGGKSTRKRNEYEGRGTRHRQEEEQPGHISGEALKERRKHSGPKSLSSLVLSPGSNLYGDQPCLFLGLRKILALLSFA